MKTLESVSNQIKDLRNQFAYTNDKSKRRSLQASFARLKPVLLILQSGITEESLRKQLLSQEQRLEAVTSRINDQVEEMEKKGSLGTYAYRKKLESDFNVSDIESRIELLCYILN
ncbi:hypothetical protein SDC9_20238 [bioreactor metagenome]|uniref:Uncharacterized protein n=1 Tax=bioreactor metagenome TaxID=1076179 RepID=A0A644U614_9ZZZZ